MAKVSVIIPTYNSPVIDKTIESIKDQSYDLSQVEIIIVGKDNLNLVKDNDAIQFIDSEASVGGARNIGIKESTGEIITLIDSDCVASKDWLKNIVEQHEKGYDVVGGGVVAKGDNYWATCYNIATFHEFLNTSKQGKRSFLPTINMSITRKVFNNVGEFEEDMKRSEDTEWTVRMVKFGYDLNFFPKAYLYHIPVTSFMRIWKKWVSTGFFSHEVRKKYAILLESSSLLKNKYLILLLSPFIAIFATSRIYLRNFYLLKYFHTFPIILATRFGWCLGAAYGEGVKWLGRLILPGKKLVT